MQAIVVIIALVFIFWGVGTQMMNRNNSAITINGEDISFQQFQKEYDQAQKRLRDRFNGSIPPGFAEKIGLKRQVINKFVQEALLRQGGTKMGLIVSPAEVQDQIQNMPVFQDNGAFSIKKYKLLLSRNGYSAHGFEDSIRFDDLSQKTLTAIEGFSSIVTDREIQDIYNMEKESVSVLFAKISPDSFSDKVVVNDKDLAAWYETVKDKYKTKPKLQLRYLDFDQDKMAQAYTPTEEQIKNYYDNNIQKFSTPEQRHARHILFKLDANSSPKDIEAQKKKAEEVLKLAKSGKDFAKLAQKYSEGPTAKQGGDLGFFPKGQMVKSFDNAVFSLKQGEISNIVRSPFGFHIIKLEAIKPAVVKPLSEVRDKIVQDLRSSKGQSLAFEKANDCYKGIIGSGSLQAYVKQHPELTVNQTDFFTRESPPEAIKGDKKFLAAAFALKQGELSSLVQTGHGYAILFAEHIKEPRIPKLSEIKDRVTKDYISSKAVELAKKKANDILAKAKAGGNFDQLIKDAGSTLQSSGLLSKVASNPKSTFPPSLLSDIFELSKTSPYPAQIGEVNKNFYVYKFSKRVTPKMTDVSDNERAQYKAALLRLKQQSLVNAWLNHEQKQAVITTSKNLHL